ncbi:MAG: DUF2867 domain-containing protein [Flavobacteriaceae bacterium]|nr:DUF2867 domain-containing protein [Flavobacteriaceae bacterium]
MRIKKIGFPENSVLLKTEFDYVDCYIGNIESNAENLTSEEVGKAFFLSSPKWIENLLSLRNKMVSTFGLKTGEDVLNKQDFDSFNMEIGEQVGLFKLLQKNKSELIFGENDKHLNFKVSLLLNDSKQNLTITTAVNFNNWFGKLYFIIIKPFHKIVVPAMLKATIKELKNT